MIDMEIEPVDKSEDDVLVVGAAELLPGGAPLPLTLPVGAPEPVMLPVGGPLPFILPVGAVPLDGMLLLPPPIVPPVSLMPPSSVYSAAGVTVYSALMSIPMLIHMSRPSAMLSPR